MTMYKTQNPTDGGAEGNVIDHDESTLYVQEFYWHEKVIERKIFFVEEKEDALSEGAIAYAEKNCTRLAEQCKFDMDEVEYRLYRNRIFLSDTWEDYLRHIVSTKDAIRCGAKHFLKTEGTL